VVNQLVVDGSVFILGTVSFVLGIIMSVYSYRIYKSFPYAALVFSPLYTMSGLVITRALILIMSAFTSNMLLIFYVTETLAIASFAVIVYMFYSLRGRIFEVFQPYRTSVLISGLPAGEEARVHVDIQQVVNVEPGRAKILDLTAGIHEISVPKRVETKDSIYECEQSFRRINPGINLVSFEYRRVH
jgi:hypothetical protein